LVHPRLPLAVTSYVVERRVRRRLNEPTHLENARANMHHLLAGVGRAHEVDHHAREYIARIAWRQALRWHPGVIARQPVEGIEHLRDARRAGRGVVISFVHHAEFGGMFPSIARSGIPVRVMAASAEMVAPGPNMIQHLAVVGAGGGLVPSDEGVAGMERRLREGEVVAVAIDVPGRTRLRFAGREVHCAAGGAVAAKRASAPIVIATSHPDDGIRPTIRLHPAIEPDDFESVDELMQHLASAHEPAVLASPASAYLPLTCWAGTPAG
jgi:lauroyl/myristoyl acyltransferase